MAKVRLLTATGALLWTKKPGAFLSLTTIIDVSGEHISCRWGVCAKLAKKSCSHE